MVGKFKNAFSHFCSECVLSGHMIARQVLWTCVAFGDNRSVSPFCSSWDAGCVIIFCFRIVYACMTRF